MTRKHDDATAPDDDATMTDEDAAAPDNDTTTTEDNAPVKPAKRRTRGHAKRPTPPPLPMQHNKEKHENTTKPDDDMMTTDNNGPRSGRTNRTRYGGCGSLYELKI
ncbi:hypothetical protein BS47DRAFT_1366860 [Hydnum rufescens UP504]|uniref:Uncharacterized protein n=1 Tax=Hydnum rufescens UP504 TaxID=1448309 RepID=A0A9P6DR05_9AGAM|nr:hypothetical protein BS47DRAFT_1366860 [Hydnum rufescens UP504]